MPPPRSFVVMAQMKMMPNNGEAGGGIHLVPLRGLSTQQGPSTDSPMGRAGEVAATEADVGDRHGDRKIVRLQESPG